MRISSTYGVSPQPAATPRVPETGRVSGVGSVSSSDVSGAHRFSVLNDFRYLQDSDKEVLGAATGEVIEPGITERSGPASAFAQQLALDRRTGELAPNQAVTAVYLRNAAAEIDKVNEGRAGFRNPYSGEVMERAVAYLESTGRGRADIRL